MPTEANGCEHRFQRGTCRDLHSLVTVVATVTRAPACVSGSWKDRAEYGGMVTECHLFQTPNPYPSLPAGMYNILINNDLFRWLF